MGEHKKIVVEHYPVERLPDDLRQGLEAGATVRVTVENDGVAAADQVRPLSDYLGKLGKVHSDPVSDIRNLRDEWE